MPNGVVGTSNYDNANRLTGISYVESSVTLASVSYTVDAVGNRPKRPDIVLWLPPAEAAIGLVSWPPNTG